MTDGLAYLAAVTLALVFAYSAATKLRDTLPTRRALDAVRIPGSNVIAKSIPVIELGIAAVLVVRPSLGAGLAIGLLGIFTFFVVYLLARNIDVSCGCFGANAASSVSEVDVVRNGFLLGVAVIATSISRPTGVELPEVILATTAAAIGFVVLAAMATRHELGQLFDNRLPGER